jgi:aerobic C4-dicarboxylate transport protein
LEQIILVLERFSKVVFLGLKYVMYLATIAAFGGMAFTIRKFCLVTIVVAKSEIDFMEPNLDYTLE